MISGNDPDALAKRLHWDELDLSAARDRLCSAQPQPNDCAPPWLSILQQCLNRLDSASSYDDWADDFVPDSTWPFWKVLCPFLFAAANNLAEAAGPQSSLISRHAHGELLGRLRDELAALCWKTVELEFWLRSSGSRPLGPRMREMLWSDSQKQDVRAFIAGMLTGGELEALLERYPVLARLMATRVLCWVEAEAEFLNRLQTDWLFINRMMGTSPCEPVQSVQSGLSDPHNRHRSVHIIEFARDRRLVYKPRDVRLEEAYYKFVTWLNERSALLPLRVAQVFPRQRYGWMEYIPQVACSDRSEVGRYYQRAGMLLAIWYALNGADIHNENIIAHGEHPVLVDAEMLLMPRLKAREGAGSAGAAGEFRLFLARQRADSVLNIGFLPQWQVGLDGCPFDCSGLGDSEPNPVSRLGQTSRNQVRIGTQQCSSDGYVEEIIAGFREAYGVLVRHREDVLAPGGPLAAFNETSIRFVFRPTHMYANMLWRLCHPRYLQHGVDRGIELERLKSPLLQDEDIPADWPLVRAELESLEIMDVPYFSVGARDRHLTVGGQPIVGFFEVDGYERLIQRVASLEARNCEDQVALIRGSLYARIARPSGTTRDSNDTLERGGNLTVSEAIEEAVHIGETLRAQAITAANSRSAWMGFEYLPTISQFQLKPTSLELYGGNAGIGLFCAALERMTGRGFGDLAIRAFQPIRDVLARSRSTYAMVESMGMGGMAGIGSIVYALVRASQFLNDPTLIEVAEDLALQVTPERVAAAKDLDLVSGCAGAVIALLRLHEASPSQASWDRLNALGGRLVQHEFAPRKDSQNNHGSQMPPTGMSHGAAGVAYALLHLYQATGHVPYKEAGLQAIAYERAVFDSVAANWPDFRIISSENVNDRQFGISWCHGAPGIGLSRLSLLSIIDDSELRGEIEIALGTTSQFGFRDVDHLCCGTMGRVDFCLEASIRLQRPELRALADDWASAVVRTARRNGGFRLFANLPRSVHSPGLFLGTAGIGYELLRLADPHSIPSVLSLS